MVTILLKEELVNNPDGVIPAEPSPRTSGRCEGISANGQQAPVGQFDAEERTRSCGIPCVAVGGLWRWRWADERQGVTIEVSDPKDRRPTTFGLREEPAMISHSSSRSASAPRARMIEDISVRGFSEKTRNDVQAFAAFIGRSPDSHTSEDLRGFQLHQMQSGMQPPSVNSAVSCASFSP
jgi:hypothetical protein